MIEAGDAQTFDAADAKLRIDDAHRIDAHFAGAGLMVIRLTGLPYPLDALGAGLSLRPDCALAPFGERSAFHDFDRHFERMNERVEIGWFAQIARIDVQGRRRIGGG
jgi:hypothetical protein